MEGTVDCLHQAVRNGTSPKPYRVRRITDDRQLFLLAHEFTFLREDFAGISGYVEICSMVLNDSESIFMLTNVRNLCSISFRTDAT